MTKSEIPGAGGSDRARHELLVAVATLYYEQKQNQQQIADRLEISRSSVSRLLSEALDRGVVEIRIHKQSQRAHHLEHELVIRFGLRDAYVLDNTEGRPEAELLPGLGRLAADYLGRIIGLLEPDDCIAIAWGRGVHAAVSALEADPSRHIDVVQMLGSIGAPDALLDGPDLARLLAAKLGGNHYYLHAPVLVEQVALRDLLLNEPSVRDGLTRARGAALAITGIGTTRDEDSSFLRAGHLTADELCDLRTAGVVGETCGIFFDAQGRYTDCAINARVVGLDLDSVHAIPRVIAVAHGQAKVDSILGALLGRHMTVLVTDDKTARAVLQRSAREQAVPQQGTDYIREERRAWQIS